MWLFDIIRQASPREKYWATVSLMLAVLLILSIVFAAMGEKIIAFIALLICFLGLSGSQVLRSLSLRFSDNEEDE